MILTYKYCLKGKRAARQLRRFSWSVNQVWNFCVATQRQAQRQRRGGLSTRWPSRFDLGGLCSGTSKSLGIHADTIEATCRQFANSRELHRRCPRFRRSGGAKRSLGWVPFKRDARQVTSSSVTYLGNTYRFFGAGSRPLPVEATKGGCFVEDARGRWWACFDVDASLIPAIPPAPDAAVGIDLGLNTLATLSTGEKIEAPRHFRALEAKLATAQRARKRDRAKAITAKIANCRRDHAHKWTARVARHFGRIFVGNVSSSKLARTRMAKSVHDAGWSISRNLLRYKASRHGGGYREVEESFTTQICSTTGIIPEERPRGIAGLGIREWECSACGEIHDRDVNAARNILIFGLSLQPLAEGSRAAYGRQPDRDDVEAERRVTLPRGREAGGDGRRRRGEGGEVSWLLPGESVWGALVAGERVIYNHVHRGGYGFARRIPATVVRMTPSGRVTVAFADGTRRTVARINVERAAQPQEEEVSR